MDGQERRLHERPGIYSTVSSFLPSLHYNRPAVYGYRSLLQKTEVICILDKSQAPPGPRG